MRYFVLVSAPLASLAACVAPPREQAPPAPIVQPPAPTPTPTPLASEWQDWPLTPGTWSYGRDARGTRAMFGQAGADAQFVLRCDINERRMYLSRAGSGTGALTLRTSSMTRALPVQPTGGAQPYVASALPARDPLLDAMAFSRGRIVAEQAGAVPLVIPSWAEIARVTEDCRS